MTSPAYNSVDRTGQRKAAGFSLIELMVAVTLGLLLILALATLLAQQSKSRAELNKSAAQVENGRYALSVLQTDLQTAGYYGQFSDTIAALTSLPNACSTDVADLNAALALPLQVYSDVVALPTELSGCPGLSDWVSGTDIIVIRRLLASDLLPTIAQAASAANAHRVYVQTTPDGHVTDVGTNSGSFTLLQKDNATPAALRPLVVNIYFVSSCDVFASGQSSCTPDADNGKPIPTLKRVELTATPSATVFTLNPLVEGVENLQADYGIDSTGSGAPDYPFVQSPTLAQMPTIVALDLYLLVRNPVETHGYQDSKTYVLGLKGSVPPFSDDYKRHVYSTSVRVINVSSRKE